MKSVFRFVLFILLTPCIGLCEESGSFEFGDIIIDCSPAQEKLLLDLETQYEEVISELLEMIKLDEYKLESAKSDLQNQKNDFERRALDILNDKQRLELKAKANEQAMESLENRREKLKTDLHYIAEIGPILKMIGDATSVEVYEGLKRTGIEAIVQPQPNEETFEVLTHTFYSTQLKIEPSDLIPLHDICSNYRSFSGYEGGKLCGGFHPDVLFRFDGPDGRVEVLICFGCSEAIIKTDSQHTEFELDSRALRFIKERLLPLLPRH